MEVSANLDVAIIGAGATGLLFAQGLKLNGIKATIYEREEESTCSTRPREWGMTLHFGQDFLARCIPPELMSRLNEALCDSFYTGKLTSWPLYNGATGEKIFEMDGFNPLRVSRRKLRAPFSEDIDVRYGKKVTSVSQCSDKATATFSDNTTATATLIVGCEGIKSIGREVLVGKDGAVNESINIHMFNVCWRVPTEVAQLQRQPHPIFKIGYHPQGMQWVQAIQDVQDPVSLKHFFFSNVSPGIGSLSPRTFPTGKRRSISSRLKPSSMLSHENPLVAIFQMTSRSKALT